MDDDDFWEALGASMSKRSVASAGPSRGELVRRAAQAVHELRSLLNPPSARISQAEELFCKAVEEGALLIELLDFGRVLQWPKQSALVVGRRLVEELLEDPAKRSTMTRLELLPLDRLDLHTLNAILDLVVKLGFPFDAHDRNLDLPVFVGRLREALKGAGASSAEVEPRFLAIRRWVEEERRETLDTFELKHSLERRLREMERVAGCVVPPRLRDLWLFRRVDVEKHGVEFDDPLDDCGRFSLDLRWASEDFPGASVDVDPDARVLVFATFTRKASTLGEELAQRVYDEDLSFALDLARPIQRDGYTDYPVLLVTGACEGAPTFVCEVSPASDEWLR